MVKKTSENGLSEKQSKAHLARWLFNLMAHAAIPHNETLTSLKGKVFLYCEALSEYTDCATDSSIKDALIKFKFFPSVAELAEFFKEYQQSNPDWKPPAEEFEPPHELAAVFEAWRKAIGPAAYSAWLMGAQAWMKPDGRIAIKAASSFKANWIRQNYVAAIEALVQQPVEIVHQSDNISPVQCWPHKGPRTTAEAWYQHNERWKNDTKDTGDISVESMLRWD